MKKYDEIFLIYSEIKSKIESRMNDFKKIWEDGSDEDIFDELVFCLMTPQSKAKSCGAALDILKSHNLVMKGSAEEIAEKINIVRFRNNKARYIVKARDLLSQNGRLRIKDVLCAQGEPFMMREWLVKNITGYGYKEAGHFLRNIGFGQNIAILDRHIIKNMVKFGILGEPLKSITPRNYLEIEKKLLLFSAKINIPPDHLDFIFWYKEAGDVYK